VQIIRRCLRQPCRTGTRVTHTGLCGDGAKRTFFLFHDGWLYSMKISRLYTREGQDAFDGLRFTPRASRIVNPNGSVVFEMKDVLVPNGWSQVAVDILAQKYFRR